MARRMRCQGRGVGERGVGVRLGVFCGRRLFLTSRRPSTVPTNQLRTSNTSLRFMNVHARGEGGVGRDRGEGVWPHGCYTMSTPLTFNRLLSPLKSAFLLALNAPLNSSPPKF
jgi:hypothetical protein